MKGSAQILDLVRRLVQEAPDSSWLAERTVSLLARERPYYDWVGIYMLEGDTLVLGPFVGKPTAHTRIPLGKGLCGAAASNGQTLVVDDVDADSRYLACSVETRSEIVVPIKSGGRILGEIDVDSDAPAAFKQEDRELLEAVAAILADRPW